MCAHVHVCVHVCVCVCGGVGVGGFPYMKIKLTPWAAGNIFDLSRGFKSTACPGHRKGRQALSASCTI